MGLDSLVLGLVNDGMGHVLQWVQLQGRYNFEMLPGGAMVMMIWRKLRV